MISAPAAKRYFEPVALPDDPTLPRLPRLFDSDWVCGALLEQLPAEYGEPERIRIHHFIHSIGRRALVSYEVLWPDERYLPPEYFVAETDGDDAITLSRYPDDPRLPGLVHAAEPVGALELANAHGLDDAGPASACATHPLSSAVSRRAAASARSGSGYTRGWMRPADTMAFRATHEIATQSGFVCAGPGRLLA